MPLIFISVFNEGSLQIARNHIQSLKNVGIDNYMAYVTDKESYNALTADKSHVCLIEGQNVSNEKKDFGTKNFNDMSYLRYKVISELLKKGDDVWYLDTDTVVLYDLNKEYKKYKGTGIDIYFQNDINMICTGCMLYFSNQRTANVTNYIYTNRNADDNDQIFFARLLHFNPDAVSIKTLNTMNYPNGLLYFDSEFINTPERYKLIKDTFTNYKNKNIYFVHANWMVGNEKKSNALKKMGNWYI